MQLSQSRRVSAAEIFPAHLDQKQKTPIERPTRANNGLSRQHLLVIGLLALANLFATITFSCIVPFFPTVAIYQKGLSTSQVGLAIGIYQLAIFIVSPLIGKKMSFLGANRAFAGGILLSGLATVALGFATFLPSGTAFFAGVLAIRTAQAVGSAGFSTGSWAIVGQLFPTRISMITGINEVAYGIGFTLGPPLGSVLYEMGGYLLPLLVVGIAQVLVVLLSLPLHWGPLAGNSRPDANAFKDDRDPGIFQLLLITDVLMTMASLFVVCVAWTFYEPDLAHHLSTFPGWSLSVLVGLMMTTLSISYLISAPIWGFLLDRYLSQRWTSIIMLGGLLVIASALLMGPAPFLGIPKSLFTMGTSYVLLGIAGAILYIPVFKWCVDAAKLEGFDEKSPALCGLISGFFQSTVSLGSFLGTFLGGLGCEKIGFAWTATALAGIEAVHLGLHLIYLLLKRWRKSRKTLTRIMPII